MTIPTSVATLIASRRDLLDRLQRFGQTPEYRRLIAVGSPPWPKATSSPGLQSG